MRTCNAIRYFFPELSENRFKNPAYYGENHAVKQCRPETVDMEAVQQVAGQKDYHGIYHQQEKAECEHCDRNGDEL